MTERNDLLDHAVDLFPAPEGSVAEVLRDVARRQRNRKFAAGAVVVGIWLVIGLTAIALRSDDGPVPLQTPTPSDVVSPPALGWPTSTKNPAGVYSWGAGCAETYCGYGQSEDAVRGFMHNAYAPGSGSVNIFIKGFPGLLIPHRGQTPVNVAGYEGTYRAFMGEKEGRPAEEWMVDIEGTTVSILLTEEPGARESELAEAHEIIGSLRTEPRHNELGFRLIFTLTTGTWDSG